jgi:N-acyl-D-aspartate/D-glutamate deacylase
MMLYKTLYKTLVIALLAAPFIAAPAAAADDAYDVAIVNGRVMDPDSGLDGARNVGVRDGKVAVISTDAIRGRRTIDAKGLVVAPGFIDLHEHGQAEKNYEFQAHDGVTTSLELEAGTADVASWYAEREGKSLINFGVSIGHIPTRM